MVVALVDTSVLVDVLRKYRPATEWMTQQPDNLGVATAVRLEVIEGAQNQVKQQLAVAVLNRLTPVGNIAADFGWAEARLIRYQLSHNVGMMDCLIASASQRLQLPLYTRNLRHFTPLLGDLAQSPY